MISPELKEFLEWQFRYMMAICRKLAVLLGYKVCEKCGKPVDDV